MALTVTPVLATVFGNKRAKLVTITFDASYLASGEPLTAADLGLKKVDAVLTSATTGAVVSYDPVNAVLKAFLIPALDGNSRTTSQLGEAVSTTDLSAVVVTVLAIGI